MHLGERLNLALSALWANSATSGVSRARLPLLARTPSSPSSMSCGPGVSSWFSSHPTTGRAYAPIPMSDLKPKRDDDSSTEEVDEARAEEGFAPLERKLQGRHLTMIASAFIALPSC